MTHAQLRRAIKGKFTHVEVFWSGRCRNPHHQGTSTPTSTRSHHHCYTLRSEEPLVIRGTGRSAGAVTEGGASA